MHLACLEISTNDRATYSTILKKIERIYNRYSIKVYELQAGDKDDESYLGIALGAKIMFYEMVIEYSQDEVTNRLIKILKTHKHDFSLKKRPSKPRDQWFDWDLTHKK
ncbi:MAG: hypothetical protein AAFN93_29445 [Bacteroidota bacterium]